MREEESARRGRYGQRLDLLLLGALTLAITSLDVLWRTLEKRPPHWDMGRHLGDSLIYLQQFQLAHPLRFLELYAYYPPFAYWVTDGFFAALGNEAIWVAVLSNVVFIAILIFATYGLALELWDRRTGVLAAFFVATTPMMVSGFKEYMLDAPLTAMVALALYLLVRTQRFAGRGRSVLFGVACGCGVLTKWTFPLPVALPVAFTIAAAGVAAARERRPRRVVNLAWAALACFVVIAPWYVHNLGQIRIDFGKYGVQAGIARGSPSISSAASVTWYAWDLLSNQLYLVPFLFFLGGVVYCALDREQAHRNLIPLLTVAGCYVAFTLLKNKDARFTDPLLPAVAVVATGWIGRLSVRVRRWLTGALVAYGAIAFLAISFGTGLLPANVTVRLGSSALLGDIPMLDGGRVTLFAQHGYLIGPPTDENWHQEDLFAAMAAAPTSRRTFFYEGGDSMWFNSWGAGYYAARYDVALARPDEAGFLIVRGPAARLIGFKAVRRYALPDGGEVFLYRRVRA